jgi:hypothetical protein
LAAALKEIRGFLLKEISVHCCRQRLNGEKALPVSVEVSQECRQGVVAEVLLGVMVVIEMRRTRCNAFARDFEAAVESAAPGGKMRRTRCNSFTRILGGQHYSKRVFAPNFAKALKDVRPRRPSSAREFICGVSSWCRRQGLS